MAELVFNEPKNKDIQKIKFTLIQCNYGQGQRKLFYEVSKETDTSELNEMLPEAKNVKILRKLSEGYSDKPENKIISLLVDSLPTDPYLIASEFAKNNTEYRRVELVIENINSNICKRVEYLYGF